MKQFQWKSLLPHAIAVGIFLVVAVIFCKPALQGKELTQSDVMHWKGMAQDLFRYKETHGHFPLWNNNLFGGMPAYQIALEASNPISPIVFHQIFMLFFSQTHWLLHPGLPGLLFFNTSHRHTPLDRHTGLTGLRLFHL